MYSCARLTRAACASSRQGRHGLREVSRRARQGYAAAQRLDHLAPQCLPIGFGAVVQQCDAAGQVIEHQQRTRCDIVCVRRRRGIETAAGDAFEVAHGIVRGVADQAAQQWDAGNIWNRLGCARQCAAQHVEEFLPARRPRRVHAADVHALRLDANLETIAETDEGVARQPLAALDAFQQESGMKGCELQIRRDRRIQIGCNVKRRLHTWPNQAIKNPSPLVAEMGSG